MKILLVGNYSIDRQESMRRFAEMLETGLPPLGYSVDTVRPAPIFGRLKPSLNGIGKWLGYIDKYLIFPFALKLKSRKYDIVHICDHSNAVYAPHVSKKTKCVVTCHDMLAVRGAMGEDTDCPATPAGEKLQRWILNSVGKADVAACVSTYTLNDVKRMVNGKAGFKAKLALNGLNHSYQQLSEEETTRRLKTLPTLDLTRPFVFHVGSNLRRKNREGILRAFKMTVGNWNGQLIFAGQPLTTKLKNMIADLELQDHVTELVKPSNEQLEALYNGAYAFFFPSRFEGFGWPLIEAQASGCPVVCSTCGPFEEVTGGAALISEVEDEAGYAESILKLQDENLRIDLIQKGLENIKRFTAQKMVEAYHQIYIELRK